MLNNNELLMQRAFAEQAAAVLRAPFRFNKSGRGFKLGVESELVLLNPNLPAEHFEATRDNLVDKCPANLVDRELGASQIEIRTPPFTVNHSPLEFYQAYREVFNELLRVGRLQRCAVLRCGSNSFVPTSKIVRSSAARYQIVPDFHQERRRPFSKTTVGLNNAVEIGRADIVSLFQAFHVNLEAQSLADAVSKTNYSLMFGPVILALSGNSRFLEGQDTGYSDIRMMAWELSHDTRSDAELKNGKKLRLGLPENYFKDFADYLKRTASFPFILNDPDKALAKGIGLHWLDTRIKLIESSAVVEFRILPTQPRLEEEIGLMLFWLGRILLAQEKHEQLLPMSAVVKNRASAIKNGLNGWAWQREIKSGKIKQCLMKETVKLELAKSMKFLDELGINHRPFTDLLSRRFIIGTPSDQLKRRLSGGQRFSDNQIHSALASCSMIIQ